MGKRWFKLTLRQRIYLSMLTLILISFVVSGVTAYLNFKSQEEDYNLQRLQRKEQAVQESMRYFLEQLGGRMPTDSVAYYFTDKIGELSDVHRLAVNLYSLRGELLISSSPENIKELGFSQSIDYTVMKQLSTGNTRAEQMRDIDYGTFVMAYWYFVDLEGKPIAITNVRYDKQEIDRSELRDFLVGLTKIYILLFLGASTLAFVLSNYIISSLQNISRRMMLVDLQAQNEPIEWGSNDEIGALVAAYNRMLKEVEGAADKLARNEREMAWREMAKQVAHEIKNPLTPMKLRVQHLQRSLDPADPKYTEKLQGFCDAMIEQITSLANIAGEFSDFAKMPRAENSSVNIGELLRNAVEIYAQGADFEVQLNQKCSDEEAWVFADKEQLLRVFNNLITNAKQAIPEDQEGRVLISLYRADGDVVIDVRDNGTGIQEEMRDKIFVPSFTTKSTGAGLGLAIVRNIVEQAQGSITFTTEVGVGSTFTVRLPHKSPDETA
jgi:signal transduction histidine kinase